jgi:hypothetical protein
MVFFAETAQPGLRSRPPRSPNKTIELGHSQLGRFLGRSLPPPFLLMSCHFVIIQNPQIPSFLFLNHVFITPKFPLSCDFQNVGLGMERQPRDEKTHIFTKDVVGLVLEEM